MLATATRMTVIDHPRSFRDGTRVLMLTGRHKDGLQEERKVFRITHSYEAFDKSLENLIGLAVPGERVYATAAPRHMKVAVREFKRRQLDADYDDDPMRFYRSIDARWVSCLMDPASQLGKLWMFDCDSSADEEAVIEALDAVYDKSRLMYRYATKSGAHILVQPFDRSFLGDYVRGMIHENPIMLWAY